VVMSRRGGKEPAEEVMGHQGQSATRGPGGNEGSSASEDRAVGLVGRVYPRPRLSKFEDRIARRAL
jgi:hypothetical protein